MDPIRCPRPATRRSPAGARIRRAAVAAVALLALTCAGSSQDPRPPNVVLIVLDTTRADRLSLYGFDRETTPALEALSEDAVVYTAAHATAPWTLPSHASMFTGLLPGEHGANLRMLDADEPRSLVELLSLRHMPRTGRRMLPRLLADRGYQTVGISSNPWISPRMEFDEGFDFFVNNKTAKKEVDVAAAELRGMEIPISAELARNGFGQSLVLLDGFIRTEGFRPPFFLFLNVMDAHYPYLSPPEFRFDFGGDPDRYPVARPGEHAVIAGAAEIDFDVVRPFYDASLRYMDEMIGRLVEWLRREGWYDDTLVVVTSDHGEHLGEEGRFSHQLSVEEELLHVPLLIKYPGGLRAGAVDPAPGVSTLDLYATILAAAGVEREPAGALTSRDLAPPTRAARPFKLAEYYYSDAYLSIFRRLNPDFDVEAHRGVRRVVYGCGRRFVFRDTRLVEVERTGRRRGEPAPGCRERARRWLARYVRSLPDFDYATGDASEADPDFVEQLRALGYAE